MNLEIKGRQRVKQNPLDHLNNESNTIGMPKLRPCDPAKCILHPNNSGKSGGLIG